MLQSILAYNQTGSRANILKAKLFAARRLPARNRTLPLPRPARPSRLLNHDQFHLCRCRNPLGQPKPNGYLVELTLNHKQELGSGYLNAGFSLWFFTVDPRLDGPLLFPTCAEIN